MARVTVEDCAEIVSNRFELVAVAAQRARMIASGSPINLPRDNDKDAVVALREIAEKLIDVDGLKELIVRNSQKMVNVDEHGIENFNYNSTSSVASEATNELKSFQSKGSSEDSSDSDLMYGSDNIVDVQD